GKAKDASGDKSSDSEAASANTTTGGDGGGAGDASNVTVNRSGAISTQGAESNGILAQSIGGGGGTGAFAVGAGISIDNNASSTV
ncbi:hypothetical protein C1Y12_29725, partial [Pseudomonas sp. FW305-47B]